MNFELVKNNKKEICNNNNNWLSTNVNLSDIYGYLSSIQYDNYDFGFLQMLGEKIRSGYIKSLLCKNTEKDEKLFYKVLGWNIQELQQFEIDCEIGKDFFMWDAKNNSSNASPDINNDTIMVTFGGYAKKYFGNNEFRGKNVYNKYNIMHLFNHFWTTEENIRNTVGPIFSVNDLICMANIIKYVYDNKGIELYYMS